MAGTRSCDSDYKMDSPGRKQAEIREELTHYIETLSTRLDQHANNQVAIVEILG